MNAHLYVGSATTTELVPVPGPDPALAHVFAWRTASSEPEPDGLRLTREILGDPGALADINTARDEIARGDVVRGVDAVRALRPRR
jgi:hypothetical protein